MTAPGGSNRQVRIIISADVAQAIRALGQTEQALGGVSGQAEQAGKSTRTMGDVMKGTLAASGIQAGISGIVDGFKGMVNSGLEYERNLNTFSAVTKASADQMQQMGDTAKQLGADVKIPGASAQSAAAAMTELAKGGLNADQAMQAARGTMILAAAAQIDGAQAAEIQANALNTFGLKADQAGRVANVLANVANQSSGEITDFSQALSAGGTVASSFGWSIEDVTTVLGLMANAGIKGSDAGTSLKSALTYLLNPSKQAAAALEELGIQTHDANGNMISARELTEKLAAAKATMTDAEYNQLVAQALGQDAVRTGIVLGQQATDGFDKMAGALGNVNGAQDVAAANSKGLSGVIDALKNTVDTASLALFERLQPSIMQVAEAATGLVTPLADALAPALGSVADLATGTLAPAITGVSGVLTAIVEPLSSVIGWFSDLPSPIGTAVLALGGVIALRGPLVGTFTAATGSFSTLLATIRGTAGAAAAGSAGFAGFIASIRAASGAAATFGVVAKGALSVLGGPIGLAIIGVTTALSLFSSSSDDAATSTTGLSAAIDEQTGLLKGNAAQIIATKAANSGTLAAYERLGGKVSDYVDALGGVPGAQEKVNAKIAEGRAAYDAQQKAMQEATAGTGNFSSAQVGAASAAGASIPSMQDLNTATSFLADAQGVLAGKTDDVRLANAGAAGELAKTGDAAATAGDQAATAAEKATPFGDALKEIRSAASEADANVQFLSISLLQLAGNTVPADQRARANAAAMRDVAQAARDMADADDTVAEKKAKAAELSDHLGRTLDGEEASASNLVITQQDVDRALRDVKDAEEAAADASDKQKDALDKAAQSARDMTADAYNQKAAQGDMRGAIEDAVTTMIGQRDQFIKSATDAGFSQEAAEKLADAQGLIPHNVRTTYEQIAVQDAINKADELNRKLTDLDKKEFYYKVVGTEVQKFVTGSYAPEDLHAEGGYISGPGTGTSDSIRARLSNGEFVVRASQTARHRDVLEMINTPGFAEGGLVGNKVTGKFETADFSAGLGNIIASFDKVMKEKVLSFGATGARDAFLKAILSKQGTSYVWGAAGPDVFDCSGLMSWGLDQAGVGKGRLTAEGFNSGFPATSTPRPGDMVTFDTGRLPGQAGHIGAVVNPASQMMMHTDGAGPARVQSYAGRPGFLKFVNVIGNAAPFGFGGGPNGATGDLPSSAGGGGVEQWRSLGLDVLSRVGSYRGLNLLPYIGNMMNQIRTESSGNPNAINNYDSNARRGDPSIGLLQVIGSTFRSALRGTPFEYLTGAGQRDPRASLTASTLYSLNRYGSLDRAWRGVAYAGGGPVSGPGGPVDDMIPAWLSNGEFVMNAMATSSHRPTLEAMNAGQFNAMAAQAVQPVSITPRIEITNYVDAEGILSRTEVMIDGKLAEAGNRLFTMTGQSR